MVTLVESTVFLQPPVVATGRKVTLVGIYWPSGSSASYAYYLYGILVAVVLCDTLKSVEKTITGYDPYLNYVLRTEYEPLQLS